MFPPSSAAVGLSVPPFATEPGSSPAKAYAVRTALWVPTDRARESIAPGPSVLVRHAHTKNRNKLHNRLHNKLILCYTAKWVEGPCRVRSLLKDGDPRRETPEPRTGHGKEWQVMGVVIDSSRRGFGPQPWVRPRSAAYPGSVATRMRSWGSLPSPAAAPRRRENNKGKSGDSEPWLGRAARANPGLCYASPPRKNFGDRNDQLENLRAPGAFALRVAFALQLRARAGRLPASTRKVTSRCASERAQLEKLHATRKVTRSRRSPACFNSKSYTAVCVRARSTRKVTRNSKSYALAPVARLLQLEKLHRSVRPSALNSKSYAVTPSA